MGRQNLSPAPAQPERVNEFSSSDRAAGCTQIRWDSAGCYRMLWSATGCSRTWWRTRCALGPQMLSWALQAAGRDSMSPLQRQLPPSICKFLVHKIKAQCRCRGAGHSGCLSLLSVQMPGLLPYTKPEGIADPRDECVPVRGIFLLSLKRAAQLDISFWHPAWLYLVFAGQSKLPQGPCKNYRLN